MIRILLGIAALTLMWFFCGTSSAQPMGPAGAKIPRNAIGRGENEDVAKQVAVKNAVSDIADMMTSHKLTAFKITEEYVRKNVLVDAGHAGKDIDALEGREPFKAWVVTFRTDWWKDIVRQDQEAQRKLRAEQRQSLGSNIIIALGLVLLAAFGYVRLDELTQRRYTTWLRVAAVGLATTMVGGLWWMFFQGPG